MASDAIAPTPTLPIRGRLTETPADYNRAQPDYSGLTRFLGWFSIGLGISEIIMPGVIARLSGTRNHKGLIRFYGLREVAAGVGILSQPKSANWLWARVAGDLVDLASIAGGSRKNHRG
ncbi:MAG: hypothetical protein JO336_14550, partial [Acidobacteriia bacterium]|nr:hypothetical protein [Terriglobia bacterium]